MSTSVIVLNSINNFLRDEIFPIIGIPRETFGPRSGDIMNNLIEIRDELRKILIQTNAQS